jgi:hypothetical protein
VVVLGVGEAVFDPADEAHRLRIDGIPWSDIAISTGYASAAVCQMAVTAFLQKAAVRRTPEQQHAALQLEVDRLDTLQRGCWQAATTGEVKSAQLALKIIVERAKLLGLDRVPEDAQPQTIVIAGSEEEYIAGLKQVIAGSKSTPFGRMLVRLYAMAPAVLGPHPFQVCFSAGGGVGQHCRRRSHPAPSCFARSSPHVGTAWVQLRAIAVPSTRPTNTTVGCASLVVKTVGPTAYRSCT